MALSKNIAPKTPHNSITGDRLKIARYATLPKNDMIKYFVLNEFVTNLQKIQIEEKNYLLSF